ncbi:MAG: NADPH:quinone reductase-like Zn-dependent oxidoreductase [Gammaproteobacteria bacterium]|jgi:NADPH:quinone reductase-like Zn-dependent oxidoreductase
MVLPNTMQAVLLTGHGGPEALKLVTDYPVPKPADGEVLIEVHACGMNNTDVWVREGAYGTDDDPEAVASWRRGKETLEFPRIQGTDIVGRIVEVGGGVDSSRMDQRVMIDFSIYNGDGISLADIDYIGHGRDGGYAEYCVVPAENAYQIQSDYSDSELATYCCAYLTAEHMLNRANVCIGEHVLITGASGGVGGALIQLCRVRGAVPVAITSTNHIDAVKKLGAEWVVDRNEGNLIDSVRLVMENTAIDVVADVVAGPMFKDLINLLKPEGRYTTAGAFSGAMVELDLRTVYLKHLQINGSSQGTRKAFEDLLGYIDNRLVPPNLAASFPLSAFSEAQALFMSKQFVGKMVVVPDRFYKGGSN